MEDYVKTITDNAYEDFQVKIIKESFNIVIEGIIETMKDKKFDKDKECTLKRLHKTIDIIYNKLLNDSNGLFSEEAIKKVKLKLPSSKSEIAQIFCQTKNKKTTDDDETVNIKDRNIVKSKKKKVKFSKEIPNSIEIQKDIFKDSGVDLEGNIKDYHFFTANIFDSKNNTSYYLTYGERNKYTERELIAVFKGKEQIDLDSFPQDLKTEYNIK